MSLDYEKTICWKLRHAAELLEASVRGESVNPHDVLKLIADSIVDANRMEKALIIRKDVMTQAGIEDAYQQYRENESKEQLQAGINKIKGEDLHLSQPREERGLYEVTIKENNKVVYQFSGFAGVVSIVEKIDNIDTEEGVVYGRTQRLIWGHDLIATFAWDQLQVPMRNFVMHAAEMIIALRGQTREFKKQWVKGVIRNNTI